MDAEPRDPAVEHVEPPHVEPVDNDGVAAVGIGIIVWAVAFVVVAATGHRGDPLAVCGAGFGVGLLGLAYVLRRRAAYRRTRA